MNSLKGTRPAGPKQRIGGTKNTDVEWAKVRSERNARLSETDWTQIADAPLTGNQRAAWVAYRQALRDVTKAAHIASLVWPVKPV